MTAEPAASSSSFADLIALRALPPAERSTDDHTAVYRSPAPPERFGRTYGGQFLAQAMAAAAAEVDDDRLPHSIHGVFLSAGALDTPLDYAVSTTRQGRSFSSFDVVAEQNGAVRFRALVSFHRPEPGLEWQAPPDVAPNDLPRPEGLIDYVSFSAQHPDFDPSSWDGAVRPLEIRYIDPPDQPGGDPVTAPQRVWARVTGSIDGAADGADWGHRAGLAYLSDSLLIDQALLPHGFRWFDDRLTGASLDHAMWFHAPARADEWVLYEQRVEATGGARGLVTGRLYRPDGALVATCAQEGLIRWRDNTS
ncbi:MAG: acyl-CoA thioesterase domain-containing protein [Actinomycetota bacterium]